MKQQRKPLNLHNDTLKAQNSTLKNKQLEMISHIQTLIRREKQLSRLKQQLIEEVHKAQQIAAKEKIIKNDQCKILETQIQDLSIQLAQINIILKNLQQEYQVCLVDYDRVIGQISKIIEANKFAQSEVLQQKQNQSTIQSMIFDYERLQRILEEQRKYFKQLANNQKKSHHQRIKQFEEIKKRLIVEEKQIEKKKFTNRFKLGYMKLNDIWIKKVKSYAQMFFRGNYKFEKTMDLGINKLKNCLMIGTNKMNKQLRSNFKKWHNNVFPKNVLNNIVQNALEKNLESRKKIVILNKFMEKLNSENLSLLHLYERTKIIASTSNSLKHKEKHMAFNLWRDISAKMTKRKYFLEIIVKKTLPFYMLRLGFNELRNNINLLNRYRVASHLLVKFQETRQLSRVFGRWRLQIHNRERQIVQKFISNIKIRNTINKRIKYEKRKIKAITLLQLSMSKIQLKQYFSRYHSNVKSMNMNAIKSNTQQLKEQYSEKRKENKVQQAFYKKKHIGTALELLNSFLKKAELNPFFNKWKNNTIKMTERNKAILHLILRKEGKNKFYVMNQFRKVVQYYEKKEMHQVLTDLNRKMESINEKSTEFRQLLRQTIENLGIQSSKRLDQVSTYTLNCQKKIFFNWQSRLSIKKKYKYLLITRTLMIFTQYSEKSALKKIIQYVNDQNKQKVLEKRQKIFLSKSSQRKVKLIFEALRNQVKLHKKIFSKFIHVQNVMYFYRLECGLISIMKKAHQEVVKVQQKNIQELNQHLDGRNETLKQLKQDKSVLQQKLKSLFNKFIGSYDLTLKNKDKSFIEYQKRKYFGKYRKNVRARQNAKNILQNLMGFMEFKNYFIFWKSLLVSKYESKQELIKEQLGKINKKKKAFEDKTSKARSDIERKMSEEIKLHQTTLNEATYYSRKYDNILSYYIKNHQISQSQRYLKSIFYTWKKEYLGTKKTAEALYKLLRRTQLIEPYNLLYDEFKKYDSQFRSQLLCNKFLQKKTKNMLIDGFNYWRYNMRHGYCQKIRYKINNIDDYYDEIRNGIFSRGELLSNQIIRNKYYNIKATIFMAFKNQWVKKKQITNKMTPLIEKTKQRRVFEAMRNWKWLLFYKKTKRAYLTHKKQEFNLQLKRDVFNSLKIYRQQIYSFVDLMDNYAINRVSNYKRFAFSKIVNIASLQKNELIHARRRQLHLVLMNKITKEKLIKRKLMWKWQSWLIPRTHYLPTILKSIETRILKSAFANINEKKWWHEHYIKDIAERVTTEGYSDVNSVTNILVKQGFDPDQLKDYLKTKNQKDNRTLTQVINHMKCMPTKQMMIKGFHSWKEYVQIKKDIRRVLSKVFNFSSGLGRYFNKWRKKDPQFNEILQKQSRVNMLERYKELEKMMKEYRRDIKDSLQNCEQLKQINDEHSKSTLMTVRMAFSNMSNSVHKGMRQGLAIWKSNVDSFKSAQLNQRYDQLVDGIQMLDQHKHKVRSRIQTLQIENRQLRQKCKWGEQCGQLLKQLMSEKDGLTIDLAQKQHNLKILLQDNLRLKQKIKIAKDSALKLITKVKQEQKF